MDEQNTILDFSAINNTDEIIEQWSKSCEFTEYKLPNRISYDDTTYCFSFDEDNSKTLLTITILDGKVHLETWVSSSVANSKASKEKINTLLNMLKQAEI